MGKFQDLTGKTFGRLTVLKRAPNDRFGNTMWVCQCSCDKHTIVTVLGGSLKSGMSRSCGCLRTDNVRKAVFRDLTGKPFGRLIVLGRAENGPPMPSMPSGSVRYHCSCACGNTCIVDADKLRSGNTKSCGCLAREAARERMTKWRTPEEEDLADRLDDMKQRCCNPNSEHYHNYGGRGIYICDEWLDKETGKRAFIDWALSHGYKKGLTIDRIDNDGPYAPWNCRWVTKLVQDNNKRTNVFVDINGVRHTIADWARLCGKPWKYMYVKFGHGYEIFKDTVLYNLSLKKRGTDES